jgi:hypothetical protein
MILVLPEKVYEVADLLHQVDHHTVKMHTAFIKARNTDNFDHWEDAWSVCDTDRDGMIPLSVSDKFMFVDTSS